MPLPRVIARFNRRATTRFWGPLAPYLPHFGVVVHRGRRSGRVYRTPINLFSRPDGCAIVLTYGPESDWVKNVLAEGGCRLETRGRTLRMTNARLIHDERRLVVPTPLRFLGALGKIDDFLLLDTAS